MVAGLVAALKADPRDEGNWTRLAGALFQQRNARGLAELFQFREQQRGDGLAFVYSLFVIMLAQGRQDDAEAIADGYDGTCPFSSMVIIMRGYTGALALRLDDTVRDLREGVRRLYKVYPQLRLQSEIVYQIATAATLFEPSGWQPASRAAAPRLRPFAPPAGQAAELVCLACADSTYLKLYGRAFVEGVMRELPGQAVPALAVVNPDAAALAEMAVISGESGAALFVIEDTSGKTAEISAAARFILAPEFLDHFRRPVIFLDADTCFRPGSGDILRRIGGWPLAYLNLAKLPPQVTVSACILGAHPGAAGNRFFAIAADYLLGKLAENIPLWMFDQAGLFRAASLYGPSGLVDIVAELRGKADFPGFFVREHAISLDDRFARRTSARYDLVIGALDGALRPVWRDQIGHFIAPREAL